MLSFGKLSTNSLRLDGVHANFLIDNCIVSQKGYTTSVINSDKNDNGEEARFLRYACSTHARIIVE